jgi:hypothetical protein
VKVAAGVPRAPAILLRDVYGWFARIERGVYGLTPKGEAARTAFATQIEAIKPPSSPRRSPD